MLELAFQRDGVGELAGIDAARDGRVDAAVDRVGEVFRGEEFADALIRLVVGKQRTEQGLFGLQVVGWQPL